MKDLYLAVDAKAILGEGPIWDNDRKLLYWIDTIGKELHIYNPYSGKDRIINTQQEIGSVVPRLLGGMVLAMENGFYFLDEETCLVTFITDPESKIHGNRFNDGKCDPAGRFWAGTMGICGETGVGSLYCLDIDYSVTRKFGNVSISNGIAWSTDNRIMYYIDTPTNEVWGFDYELETGNISNKRVVINISRDEGMPDGMTIDSEGMLWIAHWGGWRVSRWNPRTGKKLNEIKLPTAQVTACAFGGDNLDILYITTASTGLSANEFTEQPNAGGLFCIKIDVKGLPAFKYKG
jgi:sugar lactone lactonase YvrE